MARRQMSLGELDRLGLTEQPKDPFRFVKYAGWAVGGVLFLWGFGSYCMNPDAGPAVKDGPRYQEDEPWGPDRVEYDAPVRDTDWNEKKGPEPASPDAGAYDWDD